MKAKFKPMQYRKLINSLSHKSDSTMPIVALIAGMAIGAALSVLFAPKKGEETRGMIADGASNLSDSMMKKFNAAKKRLLHAQEETMEVKDHAIENTRKKAKRVAEKLSGPEHESHNPVEIKVPSAGTTAWKENTEA